MLAQLPPLPINEPERSSSMLEQGKLLPGNLVARSDNSGKWYATASSEPGQAGWAMYRAGYDEETVSLMPVLRTFYGPVYVAVSDYTLGHWRFLGSAEGPRTFELPAGIGASPQGYMYLLLVAWDGSSVVYEHTVVSRNAAARNGSIRGRVVNEHGIPQPAFHLRLIADTHYPDAVTDENGEFHIEVDAPGTYGIKKAGGIKPQGGTVNEVMVVLTEESPTAEGIELVYYSTDLTGRVTANGAALPGVELRIAYGPDFSYRTTLLSWPDGSFAWNGGHNGLADGSYRVYPRLAGYSFGAEYFDVTVAGSDMELLLEAAPDAPTYNISGLVINPYESGAGVPDVRVLITNLRDPITGRDMEVRTGPDGSFKLSGLPPDPLKAYEIYVVTPSSNLMVWSNPRHVWIADSSVEGVDFRITPKFD